MLGTLLEATTRTPPHGFTMHITEPQECHEIHVWPLLKNNIPLWYLYFAICASVPAWRTSRLQVWSINQWSTYQESTKASFPWLRRIHTTYTPQSKVSHCKESFTTYVKWCPGSTSLGPRLVLSLVLDHFHNANTEGGRPWEMSSCAITAIR